MDELLKRTIPAIRRMPPRSCIPAAGAEVDSALEKLILAHLKYNAAKLDTLKQQRGFTSFAPKLKAAQNLGLVSGDLFGDINTIRVMRNECVFTSDEEAVKKVIVHGIQQFRLLPRLAKPGREEGVSTYIALELAIILLCLNKRLEIVEKEPFPLLEWYDDVSHFDEREREFFRNYSQYIK